MSPALRRPLRPLLAACALAFAARAAAQPAEEFFDRLGDTLSFSSPATGAHARLSGTFDLEGRFFSQPAPGFVATDRDYFLLHRLTVFLDAQLGARVYFFAQSRADRGFDPGSGARTRLDEAALRFTPWRDGRVNFQVGKFSTVVGGWPARHGSWENPFVTAPLPYENLTGVWDSAAPRHAAQLLKWAHVSPPGTAAEILAEKDRALPIIWGPVYTTGAAVFGRVAALEYAAELKNAALSSRPATWASSRDQWRHPSVAAHLAWRANPAWLVGLSAARGPYLRPGAAPTLAPGHGLGDYRQTVLGADVRYAWHHFQFWSELYQAEFAIPRVGVARTTAYFVETRAKFTPLFSAALRWNQQLYGTLPAAAGAPVRWGRELWRLDLAPAWRFTPFVQLKLQWSLQHEALAPRTLASSAAAQLTLRF